MTYVYMYVYNLCSTLSPTKELCGVYKRLAQGVPRPNFFLQVAIPNNVYNVSMIDGIVADKYNKNN